mgnify:CR=1 FL=1
MIGAIAGILIAFMAGVLEPVDTALTLWARESNPFFEGPHADVLAMIPFLALTLFLLLVGREKLLAFTEARKALKEEHPEPYFWAPFVYVGDPR